MENDLLILVDESDREIGYNEKLDTHIRGQLHRAFSIFIFDWNDHTMLIQKRALSKYHSGGLWSNACCSHPRKGETMEAAINHRLYEELGLKTMCHIEDPNNLALLLDGPNVIYHCGQFQYFAQFDKLSENEIDHVYLYSPTFNGFSKDDICLNPCEISEIKWIDVRDLMEWMETKPQDFSAWFRSAFEIAHEALCAQARHMDMFYSLCGQS